MGMNLGNLDRSIRVIVGLVILAFVPRTPWAWLGLVPFLTGLMGFCLLYRLFGWSTRSRVAST